MHKRLLIVLVTVAGMLPLLPSMPAAAADPAMPSRASVVAASRSAVDYFYANGGGTTSDDSWRWAPYFMAVDELYRETGDVTYRQWLQVWGDRNGWDPTEPPSADGNPNNRAAIQVWEDSTELGVNANLAPSDAAMASDLNLPASQYWWIDALFMGLPLWPTWAARTGNSAYQAKQTEFYDFLKTQGRTTVRTNCTNTGLFDASQGLWWRDCMYVPQRDSLGHKLFWSRGNGWVIAAMARTLKQLPQGAPQRAEYESMLRTMAARLVPLQGADGMWRTSLLSPSLYPVPETSGTALFAFAIAYGIRVGLLDEATYLPVVTKAWEGLTSISLKSSGFLSNCQATGEAPGTPSTTTSSAFCVGVFGLAASEIARLSDTLAVDSFTRTTANGLGWAETGGAWTLPPSVPASNYAVSGGVARITTPAGQARNEYLDAVSSDDTDLQATFGFTRPNSGNAYVGVLGRRVGSADYGARSVTAPDGSVRLQLRRSDTNLNSLTVSGLIFATGNRLRLRLQVVGTAPTTLRAKVWAVGTAEPVGWQASVTDSTAALQAPGSIGLTSSYSAGASPSPLVVVLDDLSATTTGTSVPASDTFSRTVVNGFGTSDTGDAWTLPSNAPATNFAVNGGTGKITTPAGQTRYAYLAGVSSTTTEVLTTVVFPRPTRGSAYVGVLGRRVGTASYGARTVTGPTGGTRLQLQRSGVTLVQSDVPGLTYATGDRLKLRLQVAGTAPTTLRARVWKVGAAEPATWTLTTTDSTAGLQSAGSIGLSTYYSSGANPGSIVVSFDDLTAWR